MHTRTKRLLTAVLTLALVFGLALTAWAVDAVKITGDDQFVEVGDSKTLDASVTNSQGNNDVTWTSSDEAVAEIGAADGVLNIKTAGTTTITATSDETPTASASITLTVYARIADEAAVTISETAKTLGQGQTLALTASVTTANANPNVVWASDNGARATVDQSGKVTIPTNATAGTANITATTVGTTDGTVKVTKTCVVTVVAGPTKVELDHDELTVAVDKSKKLIATTTPANATTTLTWTSSDNDIATVDADGNVKGIKVGTATITVKTSNNHEATCEVTVEKGDGPVTIKSIDFGSVSYGYPNSRTHKITITNNTTEDIVIESVELRNNDGFTIEKSSNQKKNRTVEAGKTNENWSIVLPTGFNAKTYSAEVVVYVLDENDKKVELATKEFDVTVKKPNNLYTSGSSMISTGGKGVDAVFSSFITGYPDNTFKPATTMTREQFIAILFRLHAAGDEAAYKYTSTSFNDVPKTRWSYQAMEWASQSGVFPADASKLANPSQPLTRGEMAELLSRVEGWSAVSDVQFPDINNHANELAIRKAVQAGVFQGYPDGTFRPNAETTRAEAVAGLIRYIFGGEPTDDMLSGRNANFTDVPTSHWAYKYVVLGVNGYSR